jgi:rapamycin-insensitive companion of mTOR
VKLIEDPKDPAIARKTTLLLGGILKLCSELLPNSYSAKVQLLPGLFSSASKFGVQDRFVATAAVYQMDSLNKTLYRSLPSSTPQRTAIEEEQRGQRQVELKMKLNLTIDDRHFSNLIVDTGVSDHDVILIRSAKYFRSCTQKTMQNGTGTL